MIQTSGNKIWIFFNQFNMCGDQLFFYRHEILALRVIRTAPKALPLVRTCLSRSHHHLRSAFRTSGRRPGLLWFVVRWQRLTGIQLDVRLQQRLDFLERVGMLDRHAHQRNPGRFKYLIHKLIAFLAVIALVALVIQFDPQEGTHCLGVAQQEVDMLAVDLVGVDLSCCA
mgnify:CR=1 FL=1